MQRDQNNQKYTNLKSMLRALRHRNYRLFWFGQGISLIGTWLTRVAISWLVYRLTDSALLLGVVGFAGQIPAFVLSPFAGVLVDRWNRHRILLATQVLAMLHSLVLAVLALTNVITMWQILALSVFQGLLNAFDVPARQSFVVQVVNNKKDLPNAIALNSSMFNITRLIGPALAGFLIALVGEGYCFLIDGISYGAVIFSLLAMRGAFRSEAPRKAPVLRGLQEGWNYTYGFVPIRAILLLLALSGLMGMPYIVLLPVIARDILAGGPHTLGLLTASSGVGALIGALYLASRKKILGLGRHIAWAAASFGIGLSAFAFSTVLWLSATLMLITGFCMMVQMASSNTILQTIVEDDKRGRVMSFYTMAFLGMSPIGSLFAGLLGKEIGVPYTIAIGGFGCFVGACYFASKLPALRAKVRPVYERMGIIPEVATGMQAATDLVGTQER